MRINRRIGAAIAGSVLALATAIPAAQAQTLRAIKAEFKANADFMKARAQAAQALRTGGWYAEAGTAR